MSSEPSRAALLRAQATALRTQADLLEQLAEAAALSVSARPAEREDVRYYTRSTAPIEARAWDRAVREIAVYRPGRELMVLASDLHAWIEAHPLARSSKPTADEAHGSVEEADDAIDFEEFKRTALRRRALATPRRAK